MATVAGVADERARGLARVAVGLATGAGIGLPGELALWGLAGGRPDGVDAIEAGDPAQALCDALERALTDGERRRGAHYTPVEVAERVAALALPEGAAPAPVVDPACGGGALLLGAARRLVELGAAPAVVARELLWGADLDPLAAAVTEAAIALWADGVAPEPGHLVGGDTLHGGAATWPAAPPSGFGAVVGNPPFQGQLARTTARSPSETERLRVRFGRDAVGPYVDTAALFLLSGVELAAPGARVVMVQPQSTVAARDAAGVRSALAERARLVDLWAPRQRLFEARVHVCVPVLEVGSGDGPQDWSTLLATARGVPAVDLGSDGRRRRLRRPARLGERAVVSATFRDHYYGLVPHVAEAPDGSLPDHPLVTSGLIGVATCAWGVRPVRFAKRPWSRPMVDVEAARRERARIDGWLDQVLRPKLVVASQTRVLEAAADAGGTWVPATPTLSVVPHDPGELAHLVAAVCAPPAAAWMATRAAGTALSADTVRVSTGLLQALPLPVDDGAWQAAAHHLAAGDLEGYAEAATAMYDLGAGGAAVREWWLPLARTTWLADRAVR